MNSERVILLVEDNPDDEALTIRALRRSNIANRIEVCRNGQDAVDRILSESPDHATPCVVLLDLKLPKLDGLEVLRQIRANARTRMIPVVVLTSSSEEEDIVDSYSLGANSYVRKPVEFDDFFRAVGQLGLYWLVVNEPFPDSR
ncbi:MAG: response regulator [Candidatus Hydrogenedentes bacterium]|nr:response regulator [Candidatus Hydrogenedentota bacterium]